MLRRRFATLAVILAAGCAALSASAASPARQLKEPVAAKSDFQAVTAKINARIAEKWKEYVVTPAKRTTDAEFLRRVYLDLVGRIPNIIEVSDFIDDPAPNKREEIVELLLNPPDRHRLKDLYVNHFANFWRSGLMPETNDPNQRFGGQNFENWLRTKVRTNVGYDKMVREIVTFGVNRGDQGVQAFYQANEFRAENLAAATSRFFLGNKLECAQCHNHPFAKISREQFWEYAAFWVNVQRPGQSGGPLVGPLLILDRDWVNVQRPGQGGGGGNNRSIKIPETDKVVEAKFLDGVVPNWNGNDDPREVLADWMVSPENPYFAKTAVNRLWAYFFGIGLHEPVDEPWAGKPTHPELLDELAREFADHGFDVKFMIKAIIASDAYQLSSKGTHESQDDARWCGKMAVRGMTPEQLFDSLAEATGWSDTGPQGGRFDGFGRPMNPRTEFITMFASHDKKTETQTSILQALHLMNGKWIQDRVSLGKNTHLTTIADSKRPTRHKINELYKITLSREANDKELDRLEKYVDGGGKSDDPKVALCDVYWALLNSSEFALNH